ncbi:hypothetical protein CIK04_29215, partial [Vibrio sp. 03_296]|uniref:hypothetical protein n=1 Tax=Vibrio sp. 03_296 TaxID=2024409 RepID=UPI000BCBAAF1
TKAPGQRLPDLIERNLKKVQSILLAFFRFPFQLSCHFLPKLLVVLAKQWRVHRLLNSLKGTAAEI